MKKAIAGAMLLSAFIGAIAGYWWRGHALPTQQQAETMNIAPRVLQLVPSHTPPPQ